MIRKVIEIDKENCNGCGVCADACHEGAIGMVDGKAELLRDDYCDGLGDCLPTCPTGAISFVEREALSYDKEAVEKNMQEKKKKFTGCPGSMAKAIKREEVQVENSFKQKSLLNQWPVQIKLVPMNAPYFKNARLLIAADCTAFSYGNFHQDFIKNHITLIGCPKLDDIDYAEKLTEIIKNNDIKSIDIVRMEVPCCSGIENMTKKAIMASGKFLPWQVHVVSTNGELIEE